MSSFELSKHVLKMLIVLVYSESGDSNFIVETDNAS